MSDSFNKTTADFAYERYVTLGDTDPDSGIPADDLRPAGTITAQSASGTGNTEAAVESPFTRHKSAGAASIGIDGVPEPGTDPALVGDPHLAADTGLGIAGTGPAPAGTAYGSGADPAEPSAEELDSPGLLSGPPAYRDELAHSDAALAADASGLTIGAIDYADEEEEGVTGGLNEEDPLPDVPDADEISADSPVDPAAPPVDVMPGTDILNGSTGEDD
ncbi:hypothetical protein [Paenibacillus glufosinatiresistens]|uniref:hypothetical protein n=1 Tax=Paenibacillus glufosinatiresistens TaxID=3070657 RepID=UPI00286E53D9|nr:hypothetical protein [Paenibacillus sp. YX.27]